MIDDDDNFIDFAEEVARTEVERLREAVEDLSVEPDDDAGENPRAPAQDDVELLLRVIGLSRLEWECGGRSKALLGNLRVAVNTPVQKAFPRPVCANVEYDLVAEVVALPPIPDFSLPPIPDFTLPPIPDAPAFAWTDEQLAALDAIEAWWDEPGGSMLSLQGPAGTGKTSLAREIAYRAKERFGERTVFDKASDDYVEVSNVGLTATTGRAALRLAELTKLGATTLHARLYFPPTRGSRAWHEVERHDDGTAVVRGRVYHDHPDCAIGGLVDAANRAEGTAELSRCGDCRSLGRNAGAELQFDRVRPSDCRFLFVDEASMLGPKIVEDLQAWVREGVKVLLVGDGYQLPPVLSPAEEKVHGDDYSVFSVAPGPALTRVLRSAGGVLRASEILRATGRVCEERLDGYMVERCRDPLARAVDDYVSDRDGHFLITWTNELRMTANARVRALLGRGGDLPDPGEPVLVRKNGQGFLNGQVAVCGDFALGPKIADVETLWMKLDGRDALVSFAGRVQMFDGQMPWVDDWRKYMIALRESGMPEPIPVTWGYAITAHAAQGGECRRVTVFLENSDLKSKHFRKGTTLPTGERVPFSARWFYTAQTRSKHRATIYLGT